MIIGMLRDAGFVMKAHQHELGHLYEHRKSVFRFSSVSLFQSLITASVIGVVVAFIGVALNAVRLQGNASWYVSVTTGAVVETVIVTALVTIVIEQRRKRAIRRTLELAFLNHHIGNAITQMGMVQYVADPQQHERLVRGSSRPDVRSPVPNCQPRGPDRAVSRSGSQGHATDGYIRHEGILLHPIPPRIFGPMDRSPRSSGMRRAGARSLSGRDQASDRIELHVILAIFQGGSLSTATPGFVNYPQD